MAYANFKKGDLIIPVYDAYVPYYKTKPFVVTGDPFIARAVMKGTWKRDHGPGLVICAPETKWDSALVMIPNEGPMWISHNSLVSLLPVSVTVKCKLEQQGVIIETDNTNNQEK